MIISRTPFRVSFVGGGSDLPDFYEHEAGCVLSTAIDKYMYLSVHPFFHYNKSQLKYSRTELVESADEIRHPVFRVVLKRFGVRGVEIDSIADVPASTGLGSSSAFTVGLLHSLYAYTGKYVSKDRLAREACDVEIEELQEPIGKQDQYASAFGGLNLIGFHPSGAVDVEPVIVPHGKQKELEGNLLLFYTGITRSASEVLREQKANLKAGSRQFDALREMAAMARELRDELSKGNIDSVGGTLRRAWSVKRGMSESVTNTVIDECYELAMRNGAEGGKLLGAGGGGFLLFYVYRDAQDRVRHALRDLRELKLAFDSGGSKIIHVDES